MYNLSGYLVQEADHRNTLHLIVVTFIWYQYYFSSGKVIFTWFYYSPSPLLSALHFCLLLNQGFLHKEKQKWSNAKSASKNLLHECRVLRDRLQECSVNFLADEEDKFTISPSSLSDALDLLATSDNRIGLLLAEVSFHYQIKLSSC